MPVAPTAPASETVSPELVLVDPELARRMRPIALTGAWTPALHAASVRRRSEPTVVTTITGAAGSHRSPRVVRNILIAAATAGLGFAAAAFLLHRGESAPPDRGQVAAAPRVELSPALPTVQTPLTRAVATTQAKPRHPSTATPTPRRSRVSWTPTRFATFYTVVFVRAGSSRHQISTRRTAVSIRVLRHGRGLSAGRYRWFVRPGYGNPRFRKLPGRTFYGPVVSRGVLLVGRAR